MEQLEAFLKPTSTIDADNQAIGKMAADLTGDLKNHADMAKCLFYWVRDQIKYTPLVPIEYLQDYRASWTLKRGMGFCVEKGALLSAFARAAGIPARVRLADIRNHLIPDRLMTVMRTNLFSCHGLSELYIDGKWVKATPAFDLQMCRERRFMTVEFDAVEDAIFPSHTLDGDLHIEYVRDRGFYDDVPVGFILTDWLKVYGSDSLERLKGYFEEEKKEKCLKGQMSEAPEHRPPS